MSAPLTREEEADVRSDDWDWMAPTIVSRLLATLDAERAGRAKDGADADLALQHAARSSGDLWRENDRLKRRAEAAEAKVARLRVALKDLCNAAREQYEMDRGLVGGPALDRADTVLRETAAGWPDNPDGAGAAKTAHARVVRIRAALAKARGETP